MSISLPVSGYHHDLDTPVVIRHLIGMPGGLPLLQQASFRIRVKKNPGIGKVTITATGKGDKSVYETELEIRTVRRPQVKVSAATLEAGKSWKKTVAMPGATGTNQLTLEVSDIAPVNLSSRLSYLLGYPHGCLEQITSKGFPQLYISSFTDLTPGSNP